MVISITNDSIEYQSFVYIQLNDKTVLFQTVQFDPIERTLSGASTPGSKGPGSDNNERILRIPQSSSITGALPLECLVSYPGLLLVVVGSYPPAEMQCILQPQLTELILLKFFLIAYLRICH